jgi:hypothetical protein
VSDWHIPDDLMAAFSSNPGAIHHATAASIEQHLTACRSCQVGLAGMSPRPELDAIWAEVQDRVDRAGVGFTERLLRWLRVESGPARLIAATPALRVGAVAAVGLIVAVVVLVSRVANVGEAFLVLAPVVPTALVALSFAPGVDPAGECGLATPVFGFGLVMRRAVAVEIVALLVLALGSIFIPIDGLKALGWLLPALALSLGTLAGSVRWPAPQVAAGLTMGWAALLVLAYVAEGGRDLVESAVFDPSGQAVLGLMAAGASVVLVMNRQVLLQEVNR